MREYRSFRTGWELEEAIFGRHSGGLPVRYIKIKGKVGADFSDDMRALINRSEGVYPSTKIGRSLYNMVRKELERLGIDPTGLVFLDALDSRVDWFHYSDGVFYLPSQTGDPGLLVTMDVFNLGSQNLLKLQEFWMYTHEGVQYSRTDFQTDLFRYKQGWRKLEKLGEVKKVFQQVSDLRNYATKGRPENHFVLTPYHLEYSQRRSFAKMVAGYFAKVLCSKSREMALQSP